MSKTIFRFQANESVQKTICNNIRYENNIILLSTGNKATENFGSTFILSLRGMYFVTCINQNLVVQCPASYVFT